MHAGIVSKTVRCFEITQNVDQREIPECIATKQNNSDKISAMLRKFSHDFT